MKYLVLALLFSFIGCQDLNSNSSDELKYGPLNLTGSTEFNASYRIILDRCFQCHGIWANYKDEQQWEEAGLVVAGDPDNSPVIFRIKNYGENQSDMPTDDGPIPDEEYQTLYDWVTNFP